MAFVPGSSEQSVTVEEHVARILDSVEPLPPYDQPLLEALGLPVCEAVASPMDLPSFDNSGMDGYAVTLTDVAGASEDDPRTLPVVGEAAAGQTKIFAMSPGTAVKIMTGAPVPFGAEAVVPVEWTDAGRGVGAHHPGAAGGPAHPAPRARTSAKVTCCSTTGRSSVLGSSACSPASARRRCAPGRVPGW